MSTPTPAAPLYGEPVPLVVVEGFLSSSSSIGWAPVRDRLHGFRKHLGDRELLVASVGPVSSLHDRACELYYCVKGGTVDYGADHALRNSHEQLGRTHATGLYPNWSASRPLHFLGHSMGGPTIVKLQALLAQKYFSEDDHPDMILSMTSLSAPFRGTQLVYFLGESTENAPTVRSWSIGSILAKTIHVLSYLSPSLPRALDLHADARLLSYTKASFASFLGQLWKSDWAESKDATPYDVTFEAADDREALGEGVCNPGTYYRSYAAHMTESSTSTDRKDTHTPPLRHLHLQPFYLSAWAIGLFDFEVLKPWPSFLRECAKSQDVECGRRQGKPLGEEYWANDGIVPLFSQWHPNDCRTMHCIHHDIGASSSESSVATELLRNATKQTLDESMPPPGVWNVYTLPDTHHLSIISIWLSTSKQRAFWTDVNTFLTDIDMRRCQHWTQTHSRIGSVCASSNHSLPGPIA